MKCRRVTADALFARSPRSKTNIATLFIKPSEAQILRDDRSGFQSRFGDVEWTHYEDFKRSTFAADFGHAFATR